MLRQSVNDTRTRSTRSLSGSSKQGSSLKDRLTLWLNRDSTVGQIMVAPMVILLVTLVAYPFLLSVWLSLTDKTIGEPGVNIHVKHTPELLSF